MLRPKRGARIEAKFANLKPKIQTGKNHREVKPKKKNYLATLVLTIILWLAVCGLIYFTDPLTPGVKYLFFVLIIPAIFFPLAIVFGNTRRGAIATATIIIFLILRIIGIGHVINLILLIAFAITTEFYFTKSG